ncbi:hypothetical protein ACFQU2_12320 [Siccirubricoccus deserti]
MTERSPEREAAIRALLPLAARQGWNWGSLRAALAAIGEAPRWRKACSRVARWARWRLGSTLSTAT